MSTPQKITIQAVAKEILFKSGEPSTHFDVLTASGSNSQEKNLGALYILSHLKQKDEDLSYMTSLISSLAKREFYSPQSVAEQNSKAAFERALKKLNEVLEEFFKNKNFSLNLGLAAVAGDQIYISHLGKFKVALARNDDYIDILNNIQLFNKDEASEKKFSNIISGRLLPGDKIFAYFPIRAITSREKLLNPIFIKQGQEEFAQKLAGVAANAVNFACCGIHIALQEIKEAPVLITQRSRFINQPESTQIEKSPVSDKRVTRGSPKTIPVEQVISQTVDLAQHRETARLEPENVRLQPIPIKDENVPEIPKIIRAEVSVTKRQNPFNLAVGKLTKLLALSRFNTRAQIKVLFTIAVIVIIPVAVWGLIKNTSGLLGGRDKNVYNQASENLKLARSFVSQNDTKQARTLLQAAVLQLSGLESKKSKNLLADISQTLGGIDKTSDKTLGLVVDFSGQNGEISPTLIAGNNQNILMTDSQKNIYAVSQSGITKREQLTSPAKYLFAADSYFLAYNGQEMVEIYSPANSKSQSYSLKNAPVASSATIYENNLYILSGNSIIKYADASTGGIKRNDWGQDNESGNLVSIAVDGNVFALNSDGKIISYFKGKKSGEFNLQVPTTAESRIFTYKDSLFIYLADKINKKVYTFDKINGSLVSSFNLSPAGDINDIYVATDGTVIVLSKNNKIWTIKN